MVYLDEKVGFFAFLYLIADAPFELDQASQQKISAMAMRWRLRRRWQWNITQS